MSTTDKHLFIRVRPRVWNQIESTSITRLTLSEYEHWQERFGKSKCERHQHISWPAERGLAPLATLLAAQQNGNETQRVQEQCNVLNQLKSDTGAAERKKKKMCELTTKPVRSKRGLGHGNKDWTCTRVNWLIGRKISSFPVLSFHPFASLVSLHTKKTNRGT